MSGSSGNKWASRISALDKRLEPIGNEPGYVSTVDMIAKFKAEGPLDQAGVRPQAEAILMELIDAYAVGDEETREQIRGLFRRFESFAWAAALPHSRSTADGFRAHLLHFSILDQERDPRDARVSLDGLLRDAHQAGLKVKPILREVAELSSCQDRYSWGSTRDWLLRAR